MEASNQTQSSRKRLADGLSILNIVPRKLQPQFTSTTSKVLIRSLSLLFAVFLVLGSLQLNISSAEAASPFSPGNLVVLRVGDGSAALNGNATAVFLDEYTPSGTLVQSIPYPTTTVGSNRRITNSGSATTEGLLTRSSDGRYLISAGYDAAPGTASITGSTSATVNRVIARVDASGAIDTTTALTDAISGGNPRSATSTNGTDLWIDGSVAGVRYAAFGASTSTSVSTTTANLRQLNVFAGQLYVSSASGTLRLGTVGSGTPTTTGQTTTNLPGFPTSGGSPYGFFFADLDPSVPGVDTVYVADDGSSGGIFKYSLVGGSWTLNGNFASSAGTRSVDGTVVNGVVTLYVISAGSLLTQTDATGYNQPISGILNSVATAGTNKAFRGVAFAPVGNFPTNPFGVGSAVPNSVPAGTSSLLKVTVTPGTNPVSTGLTVTADLSSIGGSATQTFFDNGTNGDAVAGDNVFSYQATVSAATSPGVKSLPAAITDAQSRGANASISLTVTSISTPPTGSGSATPNLVSEGDTTLLVVNVAPGTNPVSTGIAVSADLSSIGGSASQQFYDDGTHGDVTAGDNSFAYSIAIASGSAAGSRNMPVSISDLQGRLGGTTIALTVQAPPPPTTVKISQVYGGGGNSGSTYTNDFIEIFNQSAVPVNISGWSVQYAGATVTTPWNVTPLCTSAPCYIQPGHYYLIQESAGAGGTTALPTADASGGVLMSGTQAKVALVASTVALTGACPSDPTIVDKVGYGAANCSETIPTATLSNTTAAVRKNNGCIDTDNNSQDFVTVGPIPRNSLAPANYCGGDPARLSGVGIGTPGSLEPASETLLTVKVTPATNPPSTNMRVVGDLTPIGGAATQPFYEDATHGDQTAGDNTFSFEATIGPFIPTGVKNILTTISDDEEREETAPITLTIQSPTCGVERWSVKVGVDPDAPQVNLNNPIPTTIDNLRSFTAPVDPPGPPDNSRVPTAETTVWVVDATMTLFKKETDVDYHIVIQDENGHTMVTEIPSPACLITTNPPRVPAYSPFSANIANARAKFDAKFTATPVFQSVSVPVRIKGVGFFDFIHGQTGVAPNGIELHPILDIDFLNQTTMTLMSNVNPSQYGQPVTFTATVLANGNTIPTGVVTFYDGGNPGGTIIGTATLDANGQAAFTTSSLSAGPHSISAGYDGDSSSTKAVSNAVLQNVNAPVAGTVQLLVTSTLTKLGDGSYEAAVKLTNRGSGTALNVQITGATLGAATGMSLPKGLFNIPPGGFVTVPVDYPASAGPSGSSVAQRYTGTYQGGSFVGSLRSTLP